MPREALHWDVLNTALESLEPAHPVRVIGAQFRSHALLGAVAHDAPYYYRLGADPFEEAGRLLHGIERPSPWSDTWQFLRLLIPAVQENDSAEVRGPLWAFLIGMISHAITDIHYHPMIFYFTGNYYHPDPVERRRAWARHRLLEVYLDEVIIRRSGTPVPRILRLLRSAGMLDPTWHLLGTHLIPERMSEAPPGRLSGAERWRLSFLHLGWLQRLFLSPVASNLARTLNKLSRGRLAHDAALFIHPAVDPGPALSATLEFRNPVTGEDLRGSCEDLRLAAVRELSEIFETLPPLLAARRNGTSSFPPPEPGRSLNYGIPGSGPSQARWYAPHGLPLFCLEF